MATSSPPAVSDRAQPAASTEAPTGTAGEGAEKTKARPGSAAAAQDADVSSSVTAKHTDTGRLFEGLPWEYCGPRPLRLGRAVPPPEPTGEEPVNISADALGYDENLDLLTLSGDIQLDQGHRHIQADEMTYDANSADVVATGNAYFAHPWMRIVGTRAEMNLETDQGSIWNTHYRLTGPINARGSADQADLVDPTLTRYRNITYTACPPGRNDWSLQASELEIDRAEGKGVARHAKLRVGDVPILYTPYLSFPIDDRRKSGVLVPSIGNSDENGFDVTIPYYVNIAPNMDATLFPRYMSKRGGMLGAELRYLTRQQRLELYGEVIPQDRQFKDNGTRGALRLEQSGRYGSSWSSYVNFNAVSDDEYLEDFGNRLEITSLRNIERRGDLVYSGKGWRLLTRLQDFQTVDASIPPESRPYGRLPELLLTLSPRRLGPGIELGLDGEYDYFDNSARVNGHRLAVQPYARWPLRRPYGHLIPRVNLYSATYGLRNQDPGDPDNPSYAIPSVNLDGTLIFERNISWLGQESLQTLEPRLFYLYTPFDDQEDTPVFDSSELSFSFNSLFRQNRFTGRDRIGDANQLTLGLTSRTLATRSGYELLRASIGQILYFRDRDVQISGPSEDAGSSAIAGEFSARFLPNWSGRASFQWDPNKDEEQSEKRVLELHYETPEEHLVNLAYRFDLGTSEETRYEDTDISFRWPVNPKLQFVGRWFYSLLHSETIEAFAGVEYGQCCWRMRLLGRHLKNKPDSEGNTTIMVQMELAGLGTIGQQVDKFLERGIYGYHAE
ncbi:MAG: LPS assembly protein LptD [Pseudomonadota bacterium]|nr:LPS assembly protein LptD [Pseudomonadota bacterium]